MKEDYLKIRFIGSFLYVLSCIKAGRDFNKKLKKEQNRNNEEVLVIKGENNKKMKLRSEFEEILISGEMCRKEISSENRAIFNEVLSEFPNITAFKEDAEGTIFTLTVKEDLF